MLDFFRMFGLWTSNRPSKRGLDSLMERVSDEVRRLVEAGKRTHAIRQYRAETGASLHQALRVINQLSEF